MNGGALVRDLPRTLGIALLAVFAVLIAVFDMTANQATFERPILLAFLNTTLLGLMPLFLAASAAKSWKATGIAGYFYLGCGFVFFGLAGILAGWVMPLAGGPNPTVTVHNLGCLLAGVCVAAGAQDFVRSLSGRPKSGRPYPEPWIVYATILFLVLILALFAFRGWLPVFFDPSRGPTTIRKLVLGTAMLLFIIAGLLFLETHAIVGSQFALWSGIALWLVAEGLGAVFLQKRVGSLLGWTGRCAQYIGVPLLVFAYIRGKRESLASGQAAADGAVRLLWPRLDRLVAERTGRLERANAALRRETAEHKRIAGELAASEERFRRLVDSTEDFVFTLDREQRHTGVFGPWVAKAGLSPDDFLGRTAREIFGAGAAAHEKANLRALEGEYVLYEWEMPDGAGTTRRYQTSLSPMLDESGSVVGLAGIGRDVTTLRRAESELAVANERLALAQRASGAGTWDWDMPSGKLNWSPELFRLFGLEPAPDPTFEIWRRAMHPEDREGAERRVYDAIRERKPLFNEYRIVKGDGEIRWIDSLGDTVYGADGEPRRMIGICIDVTERKLGELALRESEARLRRGNEEKEILIREVHHRVNNNLNLISSLLGLQASSLERPEQALEAFRKSRDRIVAMALAYEELYDSEDYARVDMDAYLRKLVPRILESGSEPVPRIRVEAGGVVLSLDDAVPCGLILNELVGRAGARRASGEGEVAVELRRTEVGAIEISVADGGSAGERGAATSGAGGDSLELRLAELLARQLGGRLEVSEGATTSYRVAFAPGR